jgi:hypothetical protein
MERNIVLHNKIIKGVKLAVKKLIKERQENDDYIIIAQGDKIVKIKARKLKNGSAK